MGFEPHFLRLFISILISIQTFNCNFFRVFSKQKKIITCVRLGRNNNNNLRLSSEHDQLKKRERGFKWRKAVDTKAMNTNWWTLTDNVLLLHTFLLLFHSLFLYVSCNQCSMISVCRCYNEYREREGHRRAETSC